MDVIAKIIMLWIGFVLFAMGMKHLSKNTKNIKITQTPPEKKENPYLKGVNYIKRSELSDEDIRRLQKEANEARKREEILYSAYSIQELRYLIAEHFRCELYDVQLTSDHKVFIWNQDFKNKWRYTDNGIVEYYKPAEDSEKTQEYIEMEDTDDFDDSLWEYVNQSHSSDVNYENNYDENLSSHKAKVIKGPW